MIMTEEEVYIGAKTWLIKNAFKVVGGQPARGVDHLPVLEIKDASGERGSHRSYKPDLVAYKDDRFYIIECKPKFSRSDRDKIQDVLASIERLTSLYFELGQYGLLNKLGYKKPLTDFNESVEGVLAYSGSPGASCGLHHLVLQNWCFLQVLFAESCKLKIQNVALWKIHSFAS